MIEIEMPLAPPLSACFDNIARRGRVRTKRYNAWIKAAGLTVMSKRMTFGVETPLRPPCGVELEIPALPGNDLDNRFKASLDLLVSLRIITDDSWPILARITAATNPALPQARQILRAWTLTPEEILNG